MSDRITILGLSGTGHHGVLPEERRDGQEFVVDLSLRLDMRAAAADDRLEETVDYSKVAAGVVAIIEGDAVDLIETLADRVATFCLGFDKVESVDVVVHKPQAPLGVPFSDLRVEIRRGRG